MMTVFLSWRTENETGVDTISWSVCRDFDYRYDEWARDRHPRMKLDHSLMTFVGHSVFRTLIRCNFSPMHSTGEFENFMFVGPLLPSALLPHSASFLMSYHSTTLHLFPTRTFPSVACPHSLCRTLHRSVVYLSTSVPSRSSSFHFHIRPPLSPPPLPSITHNCFAISHPPPPLLRCPFFSTSRHHIHLPQIHPPPLFPPSTSFHPRTLSRRLPLLSTSFSPSTSFPTGSTSSSTHAHCLAVYHFRLHHSPHRATAFTLRIFSLALPRSSTSYVLPSPSFTHFLRAPSTLVSFHL